MKILSHYMKNWSMIINNNITILDISSSNFIKTLISIWSDNRNFMRNPESKISKTLKSVSDSITSITLSHYSYLILFYLFYNYYESFLHQISIFLYQISIHNKSNNIYIDILSSSLISEDDQVEKLINYVDWFVIRTSNLAK